MENINTLRFKFEELGRLFIETKSDKVFSEMYKSSYPIIKIIVKKYIQNQAIMDEVINDCYVKFGNNLYKYSDDGDNLLGWFMKISKRVALDYVMNRTNGGISDIFNSMDKIEPTKSGQDHDNIEGVLSYNGFYESSEFLEVDPEQEYEDRVKMMFMFFETLNQKEQSLVYEKYILGKKYKDIEGVEMFDYKKSATLRTDVKRIKSKAKDFLKTFS
jgi:DNA-directed RNA polymerase specialized sigma24 family protein